MPPRQRKNMCRDSLALPIAKYSFHARRPPLRTGAQDRVLASQVSATQPRRAAILLYPASSTRIIPGSPASQTNGFAHQISRATATTARAPPQFLPSPNKKRNSFSNSFLLMPSSPLTRGSCKGATPSPLRARIGASHRAIRVQNPHSASKNNHPLA